jgi:ABC-type amino acid transport substrate-binding protein
MKQVWIILLSLILLTVGAVSYVQRQLDPPVETIVASSLKSIQEQNRLSAFAARFVTVVTSSKSQFGLSAEKTLIIPALVRYEVDLAKLQAGDLKWDSPTKTLKVTLSPVEVAGPEFDLNGVREYQSGAVLLTLTDVEKLLDAANRAKAKADIIAQAKAEPMLQLARDAHRRAVERSFALPLAAAGIEAKIEVEFEQ